MFSQVVLVALIPRSIVIGLRYDWGRKDLQLK